MDRLSLVTVPMETSRPDMSPSSTGSCASARHTGDSPQPPSTCQITHPIDPQYSESVCLNVMYCSTSFERHSGKPTLEPLTRLVLLVTSTFYIANTLSPETTYSTQLATV